MKVRSISRTRHIKRKKNARLPRIRVEQPFRDEMEHALEPGETMGGLVEAAVRIEVARRRHQAAILQRGLAAIEPSAAPGDAMPAAQVIALLKAKLGTARKLQKNRKT